MVLEHQFIKDGACKVLRSMKGVTYDLDTAARLHCS